MIEDALFLLLGFCAATLIALACVPLLWSRALRLTRRRLERLVPLSTQEIDAERDGLRAQAAVAQRRLEQKIESAQDVSSAIKVELGHRTVGLALAERAVEELRDERATLIVETIGLHRELHDIEGQKAAAEKALHDADSRIENAESEARSQEQRYAGLSDVAETRRATIAALETRAAGLLAKLEDRDDAIIRLTVAVETLTTERTSHAEAFERERLAYASLAAEHDTVRQALVGERNRASDRDRRLRRRSKSLAAAETRIAEQRMAINDAQEALAALQQRFDTLQAEITGREGEAPPRHDIVETDVALRNAIVAVGDDALRLLRQRSNGDVAMSVGHVDLIQEQRS